MQFSSEERAGNITGKKVPTAESAGVTREKFLEIVGNPVRNRIALYEILSSLEADLNGKEEDRESEELMKRLGFDYEEIDDPHSEEDKMWSDKDILRIFVESTKIYLSGQTGRPYKDYAESLITAVFNDALDTKKKAEEEIKFTKEEILSNTPDSLKRDSVNDLVSESKRMALAEERIRKSLMAYHHFLSNSVSQSSS